MTGSPIAFFGSINDENDGVEAARSITGA